MLTEHQQRTAVANRDSAYDGRFVYAVVTTGVYCRPSCAARPARPENLRFFADGAAAADAGYRPCRRCRPDQPTPGFDTAVTAARYIEIHCDERLTLTAIATAAGCSPGTLKPAFVRAFGITPKAYQQALRLGTLKDALRRGKTVTTAVHDAGYGSTSRVYDGPARHLGMTPGAYRRGGRDEDIVYAARDTGLGPLLMAATARGVCFAQFGDDPAELQTRLAAEFSQARLSPSPAATAPALDAWIEALVTHLERRAPCPELPLDLRGTALQMQVWQFLLGVPEGEVVSYAEVAAAVDRPRAARAVANACGANRIAVLVPCHRVLRGDGGLGGYRWGMARKRALLDAERACRAGAATPRRS